MRSMSELAKMRVYVPRSPSRRDKKRDVQRDPKKLGKIHTLVFSSDSRWVVGFMIKRPDIAGMVKREDVFVALDSISIKEDGILCTQGSGSFDEAACQRLGLNLDTCIMWDGAEVVTESGQFLGYVMDAHFSETTGLVDCYSVQEGVTASALVGSFEVPAAWVIRYTSGRMQVRDEATTLELSGGLAGKAGEGYAVAKDQAKQVAAKAGSAASVAVDKGSHSLGHVLGKAQQGVKRATSDFADASSAANMPPATGGPTNNAAATGSSSSPEDASSPDGGSDAEQVAEKAARAVGEQIGKTRGMFSNFIHEFNDASK